MLVEELLSAKKVPFKAFNKDIVIRCLNPDHEDKNPSLRIDKITGIFNCLSCGYSGNIFNYYGEIPNWLQIRREKLKNTIISKLQDTVGLKIPENAIPFDSDWRGISGKTFKKFEAFQHSNPEFIGRIVIPVRSITGKIVAFCGRHQGQVDPKYLFYPTGAKLPLFPIVTPINNRIILVEGTMDMLNLHDKGLTNTVCAFGINKLTDEKINILKVQGITGVDLAFDNDDAGKHGAEEAKKKLEAAEFHCRTITLGSKKDPGELSSKDVENLRGKLYEYG